MSALQYKRTFIILLISSNCLEVSVATTHGSNSSFRYMSFQKGVICTASSAPLRQTNLIEIQNIVSMAIKQNRTVKALGSGHSATDIICTNGIPVNMHAINHFTFDNNTKMATVGAGATLGYLLERLHKIGRTVDGIPTYSDITIGGAIGSGSHGSDIRNPSTLADQLVGVVVVDGKGNVRNITDRETLRAFRAHLGLLGILYEITLTTIPQYKIHIRHYPQHDSILWRENNQEIFHLAKIHDRFQFFWFPSSARVIFSLGTRIPVTSFGNCETHFIPEVPFEMCRQMSDAFESMQVDENELGFFVAERINLMSLYRRILGRTSLFTQDNGTQFCRPSNAVGYSAVGYSHRMLTNRCRKCPWNHGPSSVFQFEFSAVIPILELAGAIKAIRNILKSHPTELPMTGIFFRFLSPSDGLLTMNSDRASVSLEWVLIPRKDRFKKPPMGLPSTQAIMQSLIKNHGGRAHWGKNGPLYTQKRFLQQNYPHLPTFLKRMHEFDPHEIFMNEFGRRLKYGSQETSLDSYATHCGLVDSCICRNDQDCGDGKRGSYKCDFIQNYRVCKERDEEYSVFRNRVTRRYLDMFHLQMNSWE